MYIKYQTVGMTDEFFTLHVTGKNLKTCGVSGGNKKEANLFRENAGRRVEIKTKNIVDSQAA